MISLRQWQRDDIKAVLAIETVVNHSPWGESDFLSSLHQNHFGVVAECNDHIVGFAVLSFLIDEAELLTIGVLPDCQRNGVGAQLLASLENQAKLQNINAIFLEVRESNLKAQAFYHQQGFIKVGNRYAYYPSVTTGRSRENALVLKKKIVLG